MQLEVIIPNLHVLSQHLPVKDTETLNDNTLPLYPDLKRISFKYN